MSNNLLQQTLEIQQPKPEQKFTLDDYVLFQGTANSDITTIQLIADGQWELRTINVDQGQWSATYKFLQSGRRTIEVLGFNRPLAKVFCDLIKGYSFLGFAHKQLSSNGARHHESAIA